jgi:pimeloyl-ACP methyl ester carboxylesterase
MITSLSRPLEHHYVRTNGISLHVVQAGPEDGPPLILLHGFPEFWYGWRNQIPTFTAAGFRVWAPDQRGYNLSEKPRRMQDYNLDILAADVAGLIRQTGREKAFLAGHDWGAAVAWWVGIKYPHLLEKLIILNVPHPTVMRRYVLQSNEQRLRSWYIAFFQLPWLPERLLSASRAALIARSMQGTSRPGSFSPQELRQYRRAALRPGALTGMLNWYRAAARTHTERLPGLQVTAPTRIIWGVHDVALSRELAALSLDMCHDGDLVYLEQATHWLQHDEPQRVSQLMLDFLQSSGV